MLSKSASAVKLQPPGAGLPAIEVAISRMSARIMWPLTSQEAAMQRFKREAAKILSLARSIPADQGLIPVLIRRITLGGTRNCPRSDRCDWAGACRVRRR
jgi:hypothetical protein